MEDVANFAPQALAAYAGARAIVVVGGENDLGRGRTPQQAFAYFQRFLAVRCSHRVRCSCCARRARCSRV